MAYALAQVVGLDNAINAAGITPTLGTAATSGNLLISAAVYAIGSVSVSTPAGWSVLAADPSGGNFSYWAFYKVSTGGETSVSYPSGGGVKSGFIAEYSGFTGGAVFDVVATDYSNNTTVVTSQGTGTATGTGTDALAIALFGAQNGTFVDGSRTYSNSFTESIAAVVSRGGHFVGIKSLSATGNQSCTYGCTDTGDEMAGAILIAKAAGTGDITINAGVDALAIAEQQATIGLSIPITAGVDALTLTEHAATVTLDTSITIAAGTDALVLAEQAATVALSIPITAGLDALTLTEYPATIGLGVPMDISASVDALVLAEQAASIALSMPIVASFDALTITEWPATIAGGEAAETPVQQGGHYWPDVKRDDDWKDRSAKARREFLERLINGAESAPEPVKEEIKEVIAPYQKKGVTSLTVNRSGLARLARNQAAVERLIAVYEQYLDDEDATILLLVA